MRIEVHEDAATAAERGAELIATAAQAAIAERGRALVALSGGRTPWTMLHALVRRDPAWDRIRFFQVDERDCPIDDDARNLAHLRDCLPRAARIEAMPVETGERGAGEYAAMLEKLAGTPPILDLVHLGLGPDGHTASLVPGDPVLEVHDRDVAWTTSSYHGSRRMTLTYPILDRARLVFWLVTGAGKWDALQKLLAGDPAIPAGRVRAARMLVIADAAAAGNPS